MVKGVTKQVIMVRVPDTELFDQAIFILRDDALGREGVTDRMILRQARQAAMGMTESGCTAVRGRQPLWAALGAAATGLVWLITAVL